MEEEKSKEAGEMVMGRTAKYSWVDKRHDDWLKKQAEKLRNAGLAMDTIGVSTLLHDKVLIPNQVDLVDIFNIKIKKKVMIKKRKR